MTVEIHRRPGTAGRRLSPNRPDAFGIVVRQIGSLRSVPGK
jgi:hypothetical protein